MSKITLLITCLACAGHGWRVQLPKKSQGISSLPNPSMQGMAWLHDLVEDLVAVAPPARVTPAGVPPTGAGSMSDAELVRGAEVSSATPASVLPIAAARDVPMPVEDPPGSEEATRTAPTRVSPTVAAGDAPMSVEDFFNSGTTFNLGSTEATRAALAGAPPMAAAGETPKPVEELFRRKEATRTTPTGASPLAAARSAPMSVEDFFNVGSTLNMGTTEATIAAPASAPPMAAAGEAPAPVEEPVGSTEVTRTAPTGVSPLAAVESAPMSVEDFFNPRSFGSTEATRAAAASTPPMAAAGEAPMPVEELHVEDFFNSESTVNTRAAPAGAQPIAAAGEAPLPVEERVGFTDEDGDHVEFALEKGNLIRYVNGVRQCGGKDNDGVVTLLVYQPGRPADVRDQYGYGSPDFPMHLVFRLRLMADQAGVPNNLPKDDDACGAQESCERGALMHALADVKGEVAPARSVDDKGESGTISKILTPVSRRQLADPSALITAAQWDDPIEIEKQLDAGVTPSVSLFQGCTALHLAAGKGCLKALEALLDRGVEPDFAVDDRGRTALHHAASNGEALACTALVSRGANVDRQDAFGWTPLRWAVLNGHAEIVGSLVEAGADGATPVAGLSPVGLASAAGHVPVIEALLQAGVKEQPTDIPALAIAKSMGKSEVASFLEKLGWHDEMPEPPSHGAPAVRVVDAADLEGDRSIWDSAFASSTPLIVRGLGQPWVSKVPQSTEELSKRWGANQVDVSFSPDHRYQRNVFDQSALAGLGSHGQLAPRPPFLMSVPSEKMQVSDYAKMLPTVGVTEHFAVVQSEYPDLSRFDGLPSVPPLLKTLMGGDPAAKNLWICTPPKLSYLHYDVEDSVLLQLRGSKVFTVMDPGPLHGIPAYPGFIRSTALERVSPGHFRHTGREEPELTAHFPFVNMTSPDLQLHPLFAHAPVMRIEVQAGDGLLLPAYWYHQVESFTDERNQDDPSLNIAINYWFDGSKGQDAKAAEKWPSKLHEELRGKLMVFAHEW